MTHKIYALVVVALLVASCAPEGENPLQSIPKTALQTRPLPYYSYADMDALLAETEDEAALDAKIELAAYGMTRWLGEHKAGLGLDDPLDLAGVLPCDHTWLGNDGFLRLLGGATGQSEAAVAAGIGDNVLSRIGDRPQGAYDAADLGMRLLASLEHDGLAYELRPRYNAAYEGGGAKLFVGYAVSFSTSGYVATGFLYDLDNDALTKEEMALGDAVEMGMALLEPVPLEPGEERFNDPCYYANGGGNIYGGGGGGTGTDDDGTEKNGFTGGLVSPPDQPYVQCPGASGIRVAEFHLAQRYENIGKSEVYVNVTVYQSDDLLGTAKTNDLSTKTRTINLYGVPVTYKVGKQLADVPASAISASTQHVVTPSSGYNPGSSSDWVLLGSGFCELVYDGYDRMAVSVVEWDGGIAVDTRIVNHPSLDPLPYEKRQYARQWFETDRWARTMIQPSDFAGDNQVYLVKTAGLYGISQTRPSAASSWILLELF